MNYSIYLNQPPAVVQAAAVELIYMAVRKEGTTVEEARELLMEFWAQWAAALLEIERQSRQRLVVATAQTRKDMLNALARAEYYYTRIRDGDAQVLWNSVIQPMFGGDFEFADKPVPGISSKTKLTLSDSSLPIRLSNTLKADRAGLTSAIEAANRGLVEDIAAGVKKLAEPIADAGGGLVRAVKWAAAAAVGIFVIDRLSD